MNLNQLPTNTEEPVQYIDEEESMAPFEQELELNYVNNVHNTDKFIEDYYYDNIEDYLDPEDEEDSLGPEILPSIHTFSEVRELMHNLGYEQDEDEYNRVIGAVQPTGSPDQKVKYTMPLPNDQIVSVMVGKLQIPAFIDTGSPENLMDERTFRRIQRSMEGSRHSDALSGLDVPHLLRYNNPVTFKTVSTADQTVQGIGSTILKIRLNDIDFYEFFIIMRNISYEIILGRVFMSHSNMVIDFQKQTVSITPYFDLLSVSTVVIPPNTSKIIKTHFDQEHQHALPEKGSLNIEEESIDDLVCEESNSTISDGVADITVTNKTDEKVVIPAETKVGKGRLIALRDNVLQTLKEAIDFNLSVPINDLEGVTHSDNEYWDAINKIDLEKSKLTLSQKEELFDKIFSQRGALALKGQVGALKNFYYDIKMKENARIYNKESYRMNPITRQIMKSKIDDFVISGIATRLMSQYSSPALLIKKPKSKDEKDPFKAEYRVVIDLREMNANAIHLQYTLPIIHELVTELDPAKNPYYSLLDISDAFYQIQLHPDSYKYTTFRIPWVGSYCLTRLPQGYVGGPSVFQAVIENLFPDSLKPYLTYYIDDILIMTDTPEKHIWVIERVLFTLRQHGMKLKIQKVSNMS